MINRSIKLVLERFATLYPIIGITGPRQSGKTTLAKMLFQNLPYVSLENLDIRLQAKSDPLGFLERYTNSGAIFDEVQHVPELLSYLQTIVDANPTKGRYVLTGSQNFALNQHLTQSLSGRIGMTTLLPLSLQELGAGNNINLNIFNGAYPGLHNLNMHPLDFYPSYIQTYIERDVRQIKNIENFGKFQNFLKLCAGRVGQLINLSQLAQDAGISHTTARQWLNILEASYIIFLLQPFYRNFSKRLVKMPKLYFYDTGIACNLLGLEDAKQIDSHYLKSALFENLIILEILKIRINRGLPPNIYFWRNNTGHEIDLIGEWSGLIHAIEIKFGATLQNDYIKNLKYLMALPHELAPDAIKAYIVYNGTQDGVYANIKLIPVNNIESVFLPGYTE